MESIAPLPSPGPKQQLLGRLGELGLTFVDTPTPVFRTMEACRLGRGELNIQGVFCKNLFVRDKKRQYYVICALEDTEVDLNKLRKDLGAARCLTFASEEEMKEKLGVVPGGVSPLTAFHFGGAQDITLVLDQRIMVADLANFHPLDLESTLTLSPSSLLRFLASYNIVPVVRDLSPTTTPKSESPVQHSEDTQQQQQQQQQQQTPES